MSKRGNLFVVSGFSGSGKGTVMKQLCKNEQYALSISCTSRAPRDGETNGKEYYFISHEEFVKRQAEGYFLESAIYVNKAMEHRLALLRRIWQPERMLSLKLRCRALCR